MAMDNSVLMNLGELFEMEADRRTETALAEERAKAELVAREEEERRAHENAIRVARDEERAQAEADAEAQDAAVSERIAVLRSELESIRLAREEMRLEVAARADRAPSRGGNRVAAAMATVSLIAALTATYVSWPRTEPVVASSAPVVQVDEPVAIEEAAPVVAEVEAEIVPEVEEPAPAPAARTPRPRTPRAHHHANDLGSQLDFGSDDGLIPE